MSAARNNGVGDFSDEFIICRRHHSWDFVNVVEDESTRKWQETSRTAILRERCVRCTMYKRTAINKLTGAILSPAVYRAPPGYSLKGRKIKRNTLRKELIDRELHFG